MSIQKEKQSPVPFQQRSLQIQHLRPKALKSSTNTKPKPRPKPAEQNKPSPIIEKKSEDAIRVVEDLRKKLHKELLDVLESEQKKEAEREETIKKVINNNSNT